MAKRRKVGNLLALAILAHLNPGLPMHPYELATVLRRTGKERELNIKWGSLYTVVANLDKHGFIQATGSDRDGRRPERTSYTITEAGRQELRDWLRELVAEPGEHTSPFITALSVVGVLHPDEVIALLRDRLAALTADIAQEQRMLTEAGQHVSRVFLVELEYSLAMRRAEADWVTGLLDEMTTDTLEGIEQWREFHRTGEIPPEYRELWEGAQPPQ